MNKMEISKNEAKRLLRSLELKAYRNVVDALRAQGALTNNKHEVLKNLAATLKVGEERYRCEIRRAMNDNLLTSIAQTTNNKSTENTWRTASMRKIPLAPMLAPQTVFTAFADNISDIVAAYTEQLDENTAPLNHLELRESRTEANSTRYHLNKIFEPLLANKTFRDQEIVEELQKINQSNRYSHPSEYLRKLTEMPDPWEVCSSEEPEIAATADEATLNERLDTVNLDDLSCNLTNQSTARGLNQNEDTFESVTKQCHVSLTALETTTEVPKSDTNVQSPMTTEVATPDALPMVRRAKLNAKRWNPKTQTLETPSPERLALIESSARSIANARDRSLVSVAKSAEKPSIPARPRLPKPVKESRVDTVITLTKRGRRVVRRNWGRKPNRRTLKKLEDKRANEAAEVQVEVVTEENYEDKSINNSSVLIEVADLIEVTSNDEPVRNSKTPMSNSEVTVTEEEEDDRFKPGTSTAIEISYDDETPKTSSKSFDFDVAPPSVVAAEEEEKEEEDMRPHTFNLIPASRRLKMLKKRPLSPTSDGEASAKKFRGFSTSATEISGINSLKNEISYVGEDNCRLTQTKDMNLTNAKKDVNILINSSTMRAGTSRGCATSGNPRRVKTLLPGCGDVVTKLSLMGNVRVRNLNNRRPFPFDMANKLTENSPRVGDSWLDSQLTKGKFDESSNDSFETAPDILSEDDTVMKKPVSLVESLVNEFTSEDDFSENSSVRSLMAVDSADESNPAVDKSIITCVVAEENSETVALEKLIDIESADVVLEDENIVEVVTDADDIVWEDNVQVNGGEKADVRVEEQQELLQPKQILKTTHIEVKSDDKESDSNETKTDDDGWDEVHPESVELLKSIFNKQPSKKNGVLLNLNTNSLKSTPEFLSAIKNLCNPSKKSVGITRSPWDESMPVPSVNKKNASTEANANDKLKSKPLFSRVSSKETTDKVKSMKSIKVSLFDKDLRKDKSSAIKSVSESSVNVRILGPTGKITSLTRPTKCDKDKEGKRTEIGIVEKRVKEPELGAVIKKKAKRTKVVKTSSGQVSIDLDTVMCSTTTNTPINDMRIRSPKSYSKKPDSSKKSVALPPVPKKVYDLYESSEKDKNGGTRVINALLPSQTLKTSVCRKSSIVNVDSLIEISSVNESQEVISGHQEILEISTDDSVCLDD